MDQEILKNKTIAEVLKIAEDMDIPGVSGLRKSELIYKIMENIATERMQSRVELKLWRIIACR